MQEKVTEIRGCMECGKIHRHGEWLYIESEPVEVQMKYNAQKKLGILIEIPSICPECRKKQQP